MRRHPFDATSSSQHVLSPMVWRPCSGDGCLIGTFGKPGRTGAARPALWLTRPGLGPPGCPGGRSASSWSLIRGANRSRAKGQRTNVRPGASDRDTRDRTPPHLCRSWGSLGKPRSAAAVRRTPRKLGRPARRRHCADDRAASLAQPRARVSSDVSGPSAGSVVEAGRFSGRPSEVASSPSGAPSAGSRSAAIES